MSEPNSVAEPGLERQARRMVGPALRTAAVALVLLIPGIVLVIVGHHGLLGLGVALILLSTIPGSFAVALLASASVARWAARHRPFA